MRNQAVLTLLLLTSFTSSLNILVYSPAFAPSHSNFFARLADTLTEARHNVTYFMPIIDESKRNHLGVKVTRDVIVVEQDQEMKSQIVPIDEIMKVFWTMDVTSSNAERVLETFHKVAVLSCGNLFRNQAAIEQLRSRNFDVVIAEPLHTCGLALARHLGILKVVISSTCVNYDILIPTTGEPEETSYLPAMASQVTDQMTFTERLENYKVFHVMKQAFANMYDDEAKVYRKYLGADFPDWKTLIPDASFHFVNSIPYIDFPRPTLQKTIPIGGISVDMEKIKAEKLSLEIDQILERRPFNMFISFGTLANSFEMPDEYKENMLTAIRSEPNVTFIWKYEVDDVSFAKGVDNVVFVKWAQQTALLNDKRLTAFLGHGGLGSTNEAAYLGKPTIMIPIFADQSRNANMLARQGMVLVLHKRDLGDVAKVQSAFKSVLYDKNRHEAASRTAEMLQNQPLKPKELVVKYVEFVGKYGPFPLMTPHSLKMPWYTRYNYDIHAYSAVGYLLVVFVLAMKLPRIQFDRKLFFPGSPVTGKVTISLKKPMSLRKYTIQFLGRTIVADELSTDERKHKPYDPDCAVYEHGYRKRAEETYVKESFVLWQSEDKKNKLPAGDHSWPFSFNLPENCPSSREGQHGFIRYSVKVTSDKPYFFDTITEKAFSVCSIVDLNRIRGARDLVKMQLINGSVNFHITTPKYCVSGQTITLSGQIDNHNSESIEEIRAFFCTLVTYRKNPVYSGSCKKRVTNENPIHHETRKEVKVVKQPLRVDYLQSKPFSITFEVPPVVATIKNSTYLSVDYFLKIKAAEKYSRTIAKVTVDMFVGNVPLFSGKSSEAPPYILHNGREATEMNPGMDEFTEVFPYYGERQLEKK